MRGDLRRWSADILDRVFRSGVSTRGQGCPRSDVQGECLSCRGATNAAESGQFSWCMDGVFGASDSCCGHALGGSRRVGHCFRGFQDQAGRVRWRHGRFGESAGNEGGGGDFATRRQRGGCGDCRGIRLGRGLAGGGEHRRRRIHDGASRRWAEAGLHRLPGDGSRRGDGDPVYAAGRASHPQDRRRAWHGQRHGGRPSALWKTALEEPGSTRGEACSRRVCDGRALRLGLRVGQDGEASTGVPARLWQAWRR